MRPAATADIETHDWTEFVVGAIHYASGETDIYRHDREEEMARDLLAIEGEVWGHNAGKFDWLWLLDHIGERPATIMTNGSGIISLRVEGSRAIFLDSMRVFPFSLATLSGGAKQSLSDLCECSAEVRVKFTSGNCGGYCAISRTMPVSTRARVEAYLEADVVELMRALDHFVGFSEEHNFTIGRTVGSTAFKWASDFTGIEPHTWGRTLWAATRSGYHGARAEVLQRSSPAGYICDVNSMYPWALTQPVPIGLPQQVSGRTASSSFSGGVPGVYRATVHVPDQWIPPLPLQVKTGLAFPWGTFAGCWPLPELQDAVTNYGVRVERVHSAVVFDREEQIFGAWVEKLFNLRMKCGKSSREGKWLKFLMNSLTGKLGTRCVSHRTKIWPDLSDLQLCDCARGEVCRCGAWRPTDNLGRVWEQTFDMRDPEPCAHPEWSAYLIGYARMKCTAQLVGDGSEDAVYTDTDSCWSERPRPGLSHELGEWDDNGQYQDFQALGPKSYHALVEENGGLAEKLALKGIPHEDGAGRKWAEIRQGIPQQFYSMRGLKRAKGGAFFVRDTASRIVTPNTGKRVIHNESDPKTYAPHVNIDADQ